MVSKYSRYPLKVLFSLLILSPSISVLGQLDCPVESTRNIPSGSIAVQSNIGWVIGGWGYASPFNAKNYGDDAFNWGSSNFGYGNFGDNNMGSKNYGDGNLGDRNLGNFNVGKDNCGSYNVGHGNNGQWNVGRGNAGSYNLGKGNVGTGNTGLVNNGTINLGGLNVGQGNLGIGNSGQSNYGTGNSGTENVGWNNQGSWNIGSLNSGSGNVGSNNNGGNFNLGYLNSGSNNTGAWNIGEGNVGYLAGIESSSIVPNENEIYWKNVTNLVASSQFPGTNTTGWSNLNTTNVGIAQSGYMNLGYSNVGELNVGYQLNGTQNIGGNLTGENLVGFNQQPGPGSNLQSVSIQGTSASSLLNSTVYGFIHDNIQAVFPGVYNQSINSLFQAANFINSTTCQSFTPVPTYNTFSVSVRCRGSFKITDLYCSGDSFLVYKDGKLWFTTPVVSLDNDPNCYSSQVDPEEAFHDPEFSHSLAWLPSGSYKITIVPASSRWGGGAVAIKVDDFCDRTAIGSYARY